MEAGSEADESGNRADRTGWPQLGLVTLLAEILVPPICPGCQRRLMQAGVLCGTCWQGVTFIQAPLCDRLGLPLPFGLPGSGPMLSAEAVRNPPVWNRARAAIVYEPQGLGARLIRSLKYSDRHDVRGLLASWLTHGGRELLAEADLIVPVPISRRRLLQRQFNQSAQLAREIARRTGIAWMPDALVKIRETRPQVELSGAARLDNVKGAFAVKPGKEAAIAGRRLVLIDDVITTGATVTAATRALHAARPASVDVLAIARVVGSPSVTP